MSNKWVILVMIIFIFFMFLTIRFYYLNIRHIQYHDRYLQSEFIVKKIKKKGRGVFANQDYKKGQVIEVCPCIKERKDNISLILKDYVFKFDDDFALVGFGYCSIYNDSKKPNAFWEIIDENTMRVVASKNIKKGEEICHSYGSDYWKSRPDVKY